MTVATQPRVFSGVYYEHAYMPIAKLVAYEIGSLSTSLNWIRQVHRQSYQDEEMLVAAFKELVKDQTVEGFWRFADKIRYKIERHSKSRYGRKLKAPARWEPSIPQQRLLPLHGSERTTRNPSSPISTCKGAPSPPNAVGVVQEAAVLREAIMSPRTILNRCHMGTMA